MKQLIYLFLIPVFFSPVISCTDIEGDGIDSVLWEGSRLPDETSYRNPVWEPDLGKPSLFRGATQFYAFGDEKEWSPGLEYTVPVLRSSDLMSWTLTGQAFNTRPEWAEGKLTSVSGIFSKTLGNYYLCYVIGDKGIGAADSKAPQGPYNDYGKLIDKDSQGFEFCREPFLIQSGLEFYLFFETEQGVYGTQLEIKRNIAPSLKGELFKIAGTDFTGVYIFRKSSDDFYFFGTVEDDDISEIFIGRASDIKGPYLDRDGNDLMNSKGTLLVEISAGENLAFPGHVGGIFSDFEEKDWILFQVTDIQKPFLSSGADRKPLVLSRIDWDENGWPGNVIVVKGGWNSPRFVFL